MKYLVPIYATTLFISAFLLFSVQPMVGKYLLPLMGGGPSVWNTAMLFFQLLLLGGYAYAHGTAHYLKPRHQYFLHIALFLIAALSLPLVLPSDADPTGSNPMLWQLKTMVLMAAAPFFILSSTAPLLQQWFAKTTHEKAHNPYFLYVASNIGSMLALLSYPVVIEPLLRLYDQSIAWSAGYAVLGLMLIICGLASKFSKQDEPVVLEDEVITWKRRGLWLLLAFVPSSLMLGVTTYITTDLITVPLFWVIPLALYLLSFIIAFSEKPFLPLPLTRIIQGIFALFLLSLMIISKMMVVWNIAIIHLLFFFFTALLCHQEMAALKPKAKRLTEFFLIMSVGGALGGIFNSLLAPLLFKLPIEYFLVILLSLFCRYISDPGQRFSSTSLKNLNWKIAVIPALGIIAACGNNTLMILSGFLLPVLLFSYMTHRWFFAFIYVFVAIFNPLISWESITKPITIARNYYGVILVEDKKDVRYMTHGVTVHGGQALDPNKKFEAFGYYNPFSGLADAFNTSYMKEAGHQEIGLLGLGTGSVACFYKGANRHFDYFEIDPNVIRIAEDPKYFTYLSDCGSKYDMHMGDGRLRIAATPEKHYNSILIDVFTSDNIPLHIITKEAVAMYFSKIKPDGVLIFHVSNRFFMLDKELGAIAQSLGKTAMFKKDPGRNETLSNEERSMTNFVNSANYYVVITDNKSVQKDLLRIDPAWNVIEAPSNMKPWTDDYANILRALIVK